MTAWPMAGGAAEESMVTEEEEGNDSRRNPGRIYNYSVDRVGEEKKN